MRVQTSKLASSCASPNSSEVHQVVHRIHHNSNYLSGAELNLIPGEATFNATIGDTLKKIYVSWMCDGHSRGHHRHDTRRPPTSGFPGQEGGI